MQLKLKAIRAVEKISILHLSISIPSDQLCYLFSFLRIRASSPYTKSHSPVLGFTFLI